jgi:hypothetical protein
MLAEAASSVGARVWSEQAAFFRWKLFFWHPTDVRHLPNPKFAGTDSTVVQCRTVCMHTAQLLCWTTSIIIEKIE